MNNDLERARNHLRERLSQAERWANDGFPGSAFDKFCELIQGRMCAIRPHRYVDFGDIKQSKGVRFILTWQHSPTEAAYIDVLPAPEIAKKPPWVKVKAVDLDEGSKVLSKHDIIAATVHGDECDDRIPIDEFFKKYLRRAFANDRKDKILNYIFPIERSEPNDAI